VAGGGKKYFVGACPIDGAHAHGAGLAAGEYFAACELEGLQVFAGVPDGDYFGVSGGVIHGGHAVATFADNFVAFYHYATEGAAGIGVHAFSCQ
jgi:hypothetical protein